MDLSTYGIPYLCVCGMWNISIYGISDGFPSLPHFKFTQPITPVCTQLWRSLWNESNPYAVYNKANWSKIKVCHTEPKGFIKYCCISCGIKQNSHPKMKLSHTSAQGCIIFGKSGIALLCYSAKHFAKYRNYNYITWIYLI